MCLDSSGSSSQQKSDGVEGKRGHSLLFIIVSRRGPGGGGAAKDGEGRKDTRVPGVPWASALHPSAVFPSAMTGSKLSLGGLE